LAPNTDGDDEVVPTETETQTEAEPETASDESSDIPKDPENSNNDSTFDPGITSTDLVLPYNDRSPFSSISVPFFREADGLPSIHDVLSQTVTLENISPVDYQASHLGSL
jgi:hypothetical protein